MRQFSDVLEKVQEQHQAIRQIMEKLFQRRWSHWQRFAYAMVRHDQDAEEVIQIAILKTLSSRSRFPSQDKANHYVQKVIRTTAIDFVKGKRKDRTVHIPDVELEMVKAHLLDPLELLIAKEEAKAKQKLTEAVIAALERLPSGQRMTIELHVLSEKPLSLLEISRRTGTPVSTLRSRMLSGLRRIRNHIESNGGKK
jgi:RNA polymerase sigma factor (sigma-70 family)